MPTELNEPSKPNDAHASNAHEYKKLRLKVLKNLSTIAKNIELANKEISRGKTAPDKNPRKAGNRFEDLASACLAYGLNLDFKSTALMYDRLIPSLELIQARTLSAGGKEGLLYRTHRDNFKAGANDLSVQAEQLAKEVIARSGFLGIGDKVVSGQGIQPSQHGTIVKTIFSLLKREYDTIIKIQQEEHRISLYANYANKLRSAGGALANPDNPKQPTKYQRLFPQPKEGEEGSAPSPFQAIDAASQLVAKQIPTQYLVCATAEEAQRSAQQRTAAIAQYQAAKSQQGKVYRSVLRDLLTQVILKRKEFIQNFSAQILPRYFNEVWPESYDDYLAIAKKHNHYTSDSAMPHTLKSLEKGLRVSTSHELTGYKVYFDVMQRVTEGSQQLVGLRDKDILPVDGDDDILKAQKRSSRSQLFDAVTDTIAEINNGIGHYKLSFVPQLPKVETNISIDTIIGQITKQLSNFLFQVGGEVIPKLYSTRRIDVDDSIEDGPSQLLQSLKQPPFNEKLPHSGLSNHKITYKFSFDKEGQVNPADDFLSYVKEGTTQKSNSQLLAIEPMARANWPQSVFETDDDTGMPSPEDHVVFTFTTCDPTYNKTGIPAAVLLTREELYTRHQDLFGSSLNSLSLNGRVIANITKKELELVKQSHNLLAAHFATFTKLVKLKSDPKPLMSELAKALSAGVDFDSKGYPIKLVMPEGTDKISDPTKVVSSIVTQYLELLNAHDGSSHAMVGFFPHVKFNISDAGVTRGDTIWIPVFFETGESDLNVSSAFKEATQSYEALKESHPWPAYAEVGNSVDPDIILKVKYIKDGEEKIENLLAKDIYSRGLDCEAVRQKAGITNWSFDGAAPRSTREESETIEAFVFYTDESAQLAGVPKVDCKFCQIPHYEYSKQNKWNTALNSFGRQPNERVMIIWKDKAKQDHKSVVRRHELYERESEITAGVETYRTQPISQTNGLGVYAIDPNQKLISLYARDIGAPAIEDPAELDGLIQALRAKASAKPTGTFSNPLYGYRLPGNADESVDITDPNLAGKLSQLMVYYDPLMGSMRVISQKEQEAGQALHDTFINGDDSALTTLRAQVNSPDDPSSVWYMDQNRLRHSEQLMIEDGEIYVTFPKVSLAFLEDKSITVPKGFNPDNRKFKVYPHPVHQQWVVNIPWVQSMGDAKVTTSPGTGRAQFICKTPKCPKDDESNGDEILDTITLPMPLSSAADVEIVLNKDGANIPLKQGQSAGGAATGHYQLVGDHFRQIKWLGSYTDPTTKDRIKLTHNDTLIITFSDKYKSTGKKLAFETVPVQRALEIAAGLWYNYHYSQQSGSQKWRFTNDDLPVKQMDENGQVFVEVEMKGGKTRNVTLMTALRMYARKSDEARKFISKLGKRLCSNWIRNDKEQAVTPCPGIAEHIDLPQELYMVGKMQFGKGKPQWTMATRELSMAKLNAQMIKSMGGRSDDAQYFEKRAAELHDQNFGENKIPRRRGALELSGGLCTPCWMSWYEIVPDAIVTSMWRDLEELRALSIKFCGKKTSGGKKYTKKGTSGSKRYQWFIKLINGTVLDKVHYVSVKPDQYTVMDEQGRKTSFKRTDIMWASKTGYDSGTEIVFGDLETITYIEDGDTKTVIGSNEGLTDDGQLMVQTLQDEVIFINDPNKSVISTEEFTQETGKQVILDRLGDFYVNYLSDQSFWPIVRDYLREEIKSKEGKKASGMADRRNKMANQLVEMHKSVHERFMVLIDPGDGSRPLIDLGMDDGTNIIPTKAGYVKNAKDHAETYQAKKRAAYLPWFTKAVIDLMHVINALKMWTILVKARYSRRDLAQTSADNIVSMMSLTRKDVRDRQHLSAAMRDSDSRPKYGASPFKWLNIKEGINIEQYGKVIIDNVATDQYLNGLTGIIESVMGGNCIIKLDRNDIIAEKRILVSRDEISLITEMGKFQPLPSKPKPVKPVHRQQRVDELQDKIDYIKVIGDFTSEHPWS